ncbi:MAG TPA: DUF2231 domain-containing protein [Dehalococcoidia bacterium]|nr:DUF2231 domain-containing protein [Dehalococcoidia bacterium]
MPTTIFGLPSHPLVVHVAVVLVPLAALSLIGVGWNARWRRRFYLPIMLVSLGGAAGSFLAKQSGSALRRALRDAGKQVGSHPQQGNIALVASGLLAMACVALYVYEEHGERLRAQFGITDRFRLPFDENMTLYALAIPVALLALVTMVLAGHSGATLVWKTAGSITPTPTP